MMNLKYLLGAALAVVAISCQQEEFETPVENSPKIQLVDITGGIVKEGMGALTKTQASKNLALKFDSQATYQDFLDKLSSMEPEERMALVKSYGLTSLQEISILADEELDNFFETASEADFMEQYQAYKKKYEGILIPNPYDGEDVSLYVPDGDRVQTYVVNENHSVVIGDCIEKIAFNNDLGESDLALFGNLPMPLYEESDSFTDQDKSKRFKTSISAVLYTSSGIKVHVGYQKKKGFWWKRDNDRETYLKFDASPHAFYFTYVGDYGQMINNGWPNLHVWNNKGKVDYWIGGLRPGTTSLNAGLYVWSDRTVKKEKETLKGILVDEKWTDAAEVPQHALSDACGGPFTLTMKTVLP